MDGSFTEWKAFHPEPNTTNNMKVNYKKTTLNSLVTAIAALGFIAVPSVQAEDKNTVIQIDRTPLTTEVTRTFVDGYTVPGQYRTYFTEFPNITEENVVVRYHRGRAYYVNKNDWKIVRVVDLDTSIKLEEEDAAFKQGYMIPENLRTRFFDVPNPEKAVSVRYYNNTAYYMDADFRIVRTVRLSR